MKIVRLLCLLALSFSLSGPARAGVFPMITIWSDILENDRPVVAYSPAHDAFIVVWYTDQGGGTWDIWARVVNADGSLGPMFNVDTESGETMRNPSVAYGSTQDQYLVAYGGYHSGSSIIKARRIGWNGPSGTSRIDIDTQA